MSIFKVNVDIAVYIISIIIVVLLVLPIGNTILNKIPITSHFIVFIPFCLLIITFLFVPISYKVTIDKIIINKVWGAIEINKADIIEVIPPASDDLKGNIRLFASGGLFGYFGRYKSQKLGQYSMYAGSIKVNNLLIIRMKDGTKYVISPKRKEEFLFCAKQM